MRVLASIKRSIRRSKKLNRLAQRKLRRAASMTLDSLEPRQLFTAFAVTNAADSGQGSLRQAILDANASANINNVADVINFNIPGIDADNVLINPILQLPAITDAVLIDGLTQTGAKANTLAVGSDGHISVTIQIGGNTDGLTLASDGSTIRGLRVSGRRSDNPGTLSRGISVLSGTNNAIEGDEIVNIGGSGVVIDTGAGANNRIGGATPAARNTIILNNGFGVFVDANDTLVQNNYVGVGLQGGLESGVFGNKGDGIEIRSGHNVIRNNVVSGNESGIAMFGTRASDNVVAGNIIGLDALAGNILANLADGVQIISGSNNVVGGTSPGDRNIISGNGNGVNIAGRNGNEVAQHNLIAGNFIGTDGTGLIRLGNSQDGVRIASFGDTTQIGIAGAGNLISGNIDHGVLIIGADGKPTSGTRVVANIIGLDQAGDGLMGNGNDGIRIFMSSENTIGGTTVAERNIISGNDDGIQLDGIQNAQANNITIQGNYIGTDITGTKARGNDSRGISAGDLVHFLLVGGTAPGAGNVISANGDSGIVLSGNAQFDFTNSLNTIQGNIIGLDATGTKKLGNEGGIDVFDASRNLIGGNRPAAQNVISGNEFGGIFIFGKGSTLNLIQGNAIGTDINGAGGVGNGGTGVFIEAASNNLVGGSTTDEGNIIAFNGLKQPNQSFGIGGVAIVAFTSSGEAAINNAVRLNSIFGNVGPGMDLGDDGLTPNDLLDADVGNGNDLQNSPVISSAILNAGGELVVKGTIGSAANRTYVIDFYGNTALNPAGISEGRTYLGSLSVITDAGGNGSFAGTLETPVPAGQFVTALASDASSSPFVSTSEFAPNVKVGQVVAPTPPPAITVGDVTQNEGNSGSTSFSFVVTRKGDLSQPSSVNFATADGSGNATDYSATSGTVTFAANESIRTIVVGVMGDTNVETDNTFFVNLTSPTNSTISDAQGLGVIKNDDRAPPVTVTPKLSVNDVYVTEGNSGTKTITFTITLSAKSDKVVTVNYATQNDTAKSGEDYDAKAGTLTFAKGETSKTVSITVKGDTKIESDELFKLLLSNAANATIADGTGAGTIKNDDYAPAKPKLSINDLCVVEGNSGKRAMTFTVTRTGSLSQASTVNYASSPGSASSGAGDYAGISGTLTFAAGESIRTVTVYINGDTAKESDESFYINLSAATNAEIADAQGKGVIKNDD
jgi:hypothetical protein